MSSEDKEKAFSQFRQRWTSLSKAIKKNKDHYSYLEEQVKKISDNLKDKERLLGSDNKKEKDEINKSEFPDRTVGDSSEHIQNTPSNDATSNSNMKLNDNLITKELNDLAQEIEETKKHYKPFFPLPGPGEGFFRSPKPLTSLSKAIKENKDYYIYLEEQVKKVGDNNLPDIERLIGSDTKREKDEIHKLKSLDRTVDELLKQLQITPSNYSTGNSNIKLDNNLITKNLSNIVEEIEEMTMHYQHFIKMPEGLFRFFEQWSLVANTINGSYDDSTDLKEQFKKIDNDVKVIKSSLDHVIRSENGVMHEFDVLDGDFKDLQNTLSIATAGRSNKSHDDSIKKKLEAIGHKISQIRMQSQPFGPKNTTSSTASLQKTGSSIMWRGLESEDEIMDSPAMADAKSTYDNLEPDLKLRFLCLSIFPEDSIISKRSVIYWWIGEDFAGGKEVEIEEDCFKKLCNSCLIEPIYDEYSSSPHSFRLHPWIRWMAIRIAKATKFLDFDSGGKPWASPKCPRRACEATAGERRVEKVDLKSDASKLRSLFNIDVQFLEFDEEEFKTLENAMVLQLGRLTKSLEHHTELINPTFMDHLGLLKSLRYLGLQGISRITELPDSIKGLNELRVLDLRACYNLEKLPAGITSLKKLTHLDASECYFLEYMPKGLGSLSKLQLLGGFVINSKSQDACKLDELTKLEELRKLGISLSVEATGELDAVQRFRGLQTLTITWNGTALPSKQKNRLLLPPQLTKLDLRCFPNKEAPELQQEKVNGLQNLKKLYFRGGSLGSLSGIKDSGVVSQVETVRLRFLNDFKETTQEVEEKFPKQKRVEIFKCGITQSNGSTKPAQENT